MAGKLTAVIGCRVEPELKALIEREARSIGLRPGDYLRRKIEKAFSFGPETQNPVRITSNGGADDTIAWSEPNDDDDDQE